MDRRISLFLALLAVPVVTPVASAAQTAGSSEVYVTQAAEASSTEGNELTTILGTDEGFAEARDAFIGGFPDDAGRALLARALSALGAGNHAILVQHGDGNTASIDQQGLGNAAATYQRGFRNSLSATQVGDDNVLGAWLAGSGNDVRFLQDGSDNQYFFGFLGDDLTHRFAQVGDGHRAIQVGQGVLPANIQQFGQGMSIRIEHNPGW